ncbi:hypothetical protein K469DRAFT_205141 [Zopfia rhizophila CBS 207.26]|uniref:Uncharacterized protein n=1 Tax=Zopfia rhizophila CBS 207.26 TaxID=1314779 RepID=A0A6A6DVM0_9PEZI|nr:hypothetical protein K469DRAFT_205141 [Zopfia rhizophila CBS 207.26]
MKYRAMSSKQTHGHPPSPLRMTHLTPMRKPFQAHSISRRRPPLSLLKHHRRLQISGVFMSINKWTTNSPKSSKSPFPSPF